MKLLTLLFIAAFTGHTASIALTSSGGGSYSYGLVLADGETAQFARNSGITLSGMTGVTGQSLSGTLDFCLDTGGFAGSNASILNLTASAGGCGFTNLSGAPTTILDWTVNSTATTQGLIDYSIQTTGGVITGQVLGPTGPAESISVALISFLNGVYSYGLQIPDGATVGFLRNKGLTLSGMFGVTGQTLSAPLDFCLDSGTVTSTTASILNLTASAGGCGYTNLSGSTITEATWSIQSPGSVSGLIDFSIDSTAGPITGQVLGPVAAATPEPISASLALLALGAMWFAKRRTAGAHASRLNKGRPPSDVLNP